MTAPTRRAIRTAFLTGLTAVVTAAGLAAIPLPAAGAPPGVDPPVVNLTLGPGQSTNVAKVVHTAPVPPNPDIVLMADTTGSMGEAIDDVKANAPTIVGDVLAAQPSAQFAVAEYKDFGDDFPFRVNQQLTNSTPAVQAGIDAWGALGGGDTPEAWVNALFEVSTGAIPLRANSTRIVVFFGDASSHDPSGGHTLNDAVAALVAADIRVVAINLPCCGDGLDATGQATQVTNATDGIFLDNVPAADVSQAILDGIQAIEVTVAPSVTSCDTPLSLSFAPASRVVPSGADAPFTETVSVAGNAVEGTYHCTVDFLVNGMSSGFVQHLTVVVPGLRVNDVTVPENGGPATFTVTLSPPSPSTVTVHFATSNGSATAPGDYAATSGDLSFTPGQTTKPVSVPIVNDTLDEPDESFNVTLSAAVGAAITDPKGAGQIVDNDRNGLFSCQATGVRINTAATVQANPPNLPCADDAKNLANVQLPAGLLTVALTGVTATTDQAPNVLTGTTPAAGDHASGLATVLVTKITTLGLTIEVGTISSTASVTCTTGPGGLVPTFASASSVASLKINGVVVPVGTTPLTIPLAVGSLSLNKTVSTGTSITRQALVLDTLLVDVVVGESRAGVTGTAANPGGNPCSA